MKTVSASEMRELDRRTIEEFGIPGEELMRRAGCGVAEAAYRALAGLNGLSVLLIAGTGNNGGDVFAAASEMAQSGLNIEVWICGSQTQIKGDAKTHLKKMIRSGIKPEEVQDIQDFSPRQKPDVLIDGLLGTGSKGAPRGFMGPLIRWMNEQAQNTLILSIDIPSGIDADTGFAEGPAVQADCTITMGLPKTGLIRPESRTNTGRVDVIDIGIPQELTKNVKGCPDAEMIDRSDLRISRRERVSHKGTFGHVLLIGGSKGFTGAIALAARAALRSGAGLVSVLTPEEVYSVVAQAAGPEVMVHPFSPGLFSGESSGQKETADTDSPENKLSTLLQNCDAILIGPGLGRTADTRVLAEHFLRNCTVPLVLDADALCVSPEQISGAGCPVILTPHPGEFQRIFGAPVTDRWSQAKAAADQTGAVLVLKGAGTVVAASGKKIGVNLNGNPGMAAGGSGDVLAGLLTGLLGQGFNPFSAASTAVWLHGAAGDLATADHTQQSLTAVDLIAALPGAFRLFSVR